MNHHTEFIGQTSLLLAALFAGVLLAPALHSSPAVVQTTTAKSAVSRASPDPPIVDLAAFQNIVARHHGKPLVVNFWATWCEPCRDEYPMLVELAKQYAPQGLRLVGVSFDDDAEMNLVRRFLARNKPGFPNYRLKPGTDAAFVRGVSPAWTGSIPSTMFYTPDGRLAGQFVGTRPRAEFERAIRELLQVSASLPDSAASPAKR
jgi:thiol-disulfide isomerase/thioredoxin